ncbi:MAG TPA: GNAT family N-acetyltransferase [Beijerinckiaceae bacterium]|jgi:CelD/BcsL family acetyltransferase involved in cellulose biosynthesis
MRAGLVAGDIGDAAALAGLAPAWWELWHRADATPFQSPAWLIPWWRHFQPGELFVVTVRRRHRLVGLAPFYIEHGGAGRRVLPLGISLSDYHDVLLDPDDRDAAAAALVDHLADQAARWDAWELEELAPDAAALALPCPQDCSERLIEQSACPVLLLPPNARTITDVIPARKRRDTNLARNRAERCGEVRIESADDRTADAFLNVLIKLHTARWHSRGETGVLADSLVQQFHRAALPGLVANGLLRLYLVQIGGRPASIYYGFMHCGRAYTYLTGFDPAFAFESPGVIVLAHAIAQALAEGAHEIHFLRGRETYKYEWGGIDRWNRKRSFRRTGAMARA